MIVDLPLAPISILAFLGTCLFVVAMFGMIIYFQVSGRPQRARKTLEILAGGIALYAVALIGTSLFSKEYLLGRGAEKHFCELDCHLAYSVTAVAQTPTVPTEFGATPEKAGRYLIVTLRTRFDETTIGAKRGDGLLYPNSRDVSLRDGSGKLYSPVASTGAPLSQSVRPGQAYETKLLFRVPEDARELKMFVSNTEWPNSFLIGHENSPMHKKAYFDLGG
ncbi:MAG: hypothetical protein JWO13_621 [Acidobacteriales bacterium]|nr:hypothetical protein [Terriglobales bacterium]